MSLGTDDIAFAKELFAALPDVSTRRMFGGLGIYSDGVIFALMRSDGALLIKAAKGDFADKLAGMGCEQWSHARKNGGVTAMPYWSMPDSAIDDPEEATALAREALAELDA